MAEIIEIERFSLYGQVANRLRSMLVEGRIGPGTKLVERELCERLQVSRTPLREAIKILATEGLLDLIPNRGAIAVRLNQADVTDAFEVLAGLEGLAGELAAERITEEELAGIRSLHFEMLACYARGQLPAYYHLNAAIHAGITKAARNPLLARTHAGVNARVQAMRFKTNFDQVKWRRAVDEHERIVEALSARDGRRLRQILIHHLKNKRDSVLELMKCDAGAAPPKP